MEPKNHLMEWLTAPMITVVEDDYVDFPTRVIENNRQAKLRALLAEADGLAKEEVVSLLRSPQTRLINALKFRAKELQSVNEIIEQELAEELAAEAQVQANLKVNKDWGMF